MSSKDTPAQVDVVRVVSGGGGFLTLRASGRNRSWGKCSAGGPKVNVLHHGAAALSLLQIFGDLMSDPSWEFAHFAPMPQMTSLQSGERLRLPRTWRRCRFRFWTRLTAALPLSVELLWTHMLSLSPAHLRWSSSAFGSQTESGLWPGPYQNRFYGNVFWSRDRRDKTGLFPRSIRTGFPLDRYWSQYCVLSPDQFMLLLHHISDAHSSRKYLKYEGFKNEMDNKYLIYYIII